MDTCKCGCGEPVKRGRVFVNKEHQLEWMNNGGARQLNALLPIEARVQGGKIAGDAAAASGRLVDAARKGGERAREIADAYRARRGEKSSEA